MYIQVSEMFYISSPSRYAYSYMLNYYANYVSYLHSWSDETKTTVHLEAWLVAWQLKIYIAKSSARYVHTVMKLAYQYYKHRISSKSRHSEILFQGSVWCGDNSSMARFRGWHLQRLTRTCIHSFNRYMHVKRLCAYGNWCRPLTMWRDFEGGVYWDELADRCSDISRAAGFRGAARFRGNTVVVIS